MASGGYSDNVNLFSHVTPLTPNQVVNYPGMLLGHYASLSIIVKASSPLSVTVFYSGDGKNYDASIVKNFGAGAGKIQSVVVQSKWVKLRIINTSNQLHTYTRVFVHGNFFNSAITAEIGMIGNLPPSVSISDDLNRTAFDEICTQTFIPVQSIKFDRIKEALVNPTLLNFDSPYERYYELFPFTDRADLIPPDADFGWARMVSHTTQDILASKVIPYHPGIAMEARFTASFKQPPAFQAQHDANAPMLIGFINPTGVVPGDNTDDADITDAAMIGYHTNDTTNLELEIVWIRNGVIKSVTKQSDWNIDPADGTYILPSIDPTKMNIFRITYGYLGAADIIFSIQDAASKFRPVHALRTINTYETTSFSTSGMRFGMWVLNAVNAPSPTNLVHEIGTASWSIGRLGSGPIITSSPIIHVKSASSVAAGPLLLFTLRNKDISENFLDSCNTTVYLLKSMNITTASSGAAGARGYFNITRNCELTPPAQPPAQDFTDIEPNKHALQYNDVATGFTGGILVYSVPLSETINSNFNLIPGSADSSMFEFQPGTTYTFWINVTVPSGILTANLTTSCNYI